MTGRNRNGEAGFALVESIAVLALAALVFVTLLLATDLVSRTSAAAARRATIMETLMTGLNAVRRDLEGARHVRTGEKKEDAVLFSGGPQRVAVVVPDDGTGVGEGESLILIQTRYEGDGLGALVRSSARMLPGTMGFGSAAFGNTAVLVSGPWKYQFTYADSEGGAGRWRNAWTATNRMPAAIRLEVLGSSGARVFPPFIVRLAIESGGCSDAAHVDCSGDQAEAADEQQEVPNPDDNQNPGNNQ